MMELFWKNFERLKPVNHFHKKAPSKIFDRSLNTPLPWWKIIEQQSLCLGSCYKPRNWIALLFTLKNLRVQTGWILGSIGSKKEKNCFRKVQKPEVVMSQVSTFMHNIFEMFTSSSIITLSSAVASLDYFSRCNRCRQICWLLSPWSFCLLVLFFYFRLDSFSLLLLFFQKTPGFSAWEFYQLENRFQADQCQLNWWSYLFSPQAPWQGFRHWAMTDSFHRTKEFLT